MQSLSAASLIEFGQRVFTTLGTPDDLAATVAASLVGANLSGHDSHGVIQLPVYAGLVRDGQVQPAARARVAPAAGMLATLAVDGAFGWGPPAGFLTTAAIAERATQFGVSAAVIRNCHHIGRVGQYVEHLAGQNLIGIAMCNAGSAVVPFGGKQRMLGTNPIAIAVPRPNSSPPVLFDGSTAVVAGNKVRVLLDKGLPTPPGWIVDINGQATTQPEDFFNGGGLLPLGGHKGYGLGVMVDLLGGLLSDATADFFAAHGSMNGVMMIALRPDAFVPLDIYLERVERACAALKASPSIDPASEVLLPGEPEQRTRRERVQTGIPLPDATLESLRVLAGELGVQLN